MGLIGMHMKLHRYTQIIMPVDRYISQLAPRVRKLVIVMEGGLVLVLLTSVLFYMGH